MKDKTMITKTDLLELGYIVKGYMDEGEIDFVHPDRSGKFIIALTTDGSVNITFQHSLNLPIKTFDSLQKFTVWHNNIMV